MPTTKKKPTTKKRGFQLQARGEGDLKTRYRPQRLSEIAPTFAITKAKKIIAEDPNSSQVFLLVGITGSGKTSLARIIARACVCEAEEGEKPCLECGSCKGLEDSYDFTEVNVARFGKIDDVKDIISGMIYQPSSLRRRIYIFDEVHQLTPASQELLNKVLEEPVGSTLIFLCTSEKKGLKRTLMGRAAPFPFKRMTSAQCETIITQICENEEAEVPDLKTIKDMFRRADGSVRDLLNLLDLWMDDEYEVGLDETEDAPPDIRDMAKALMSQNWPKVARFLQSEKIKTQPESYRIAVTNYIRGCALGSPSFDQAAATALGQLCGTLADQPKIEQYNMLVLRCMRACKARARGR